MSGAVGGATYNALSRMLAATTSLQAQEATLQEQTTSGKVAQSYAGLAPASAQVLDLSAASSRLDAYATTIAAAQGKASVAQDALSQAGTLATGLATAALGLSASSPASAVESVAQRAKQALTQLGSLLNASYAGDYVFAGADTANPPVPAAIATSGMYAQIGSQVAALATVPTAPAVGTVIANTVAIAGNTAAGTTAFSAFLSGPAVAMPTVTIGDNQQVSVSVPANRNAGAVSDPAIHGTGSAMGDIMRSLAVLANSTGPMAGNPDFTTLMKDAATTLNSAAGTLTQESAQLGLTQNTLTAASAAHSSLQTILKSQLSGLTDVNMAQAVSQLQAVTNQLTASYKVIGMTSSLNLASYL